MRKIITTFLICLPFLAIGQLHKVVITKNDGNIHQNHFSKKDKLRRHILLEATVDSIYTLNRKNEILSYSLNDIRDPRLSIADLITYTQIYTTTGDFIRGRLISENEESVKVEISRNTVITVPKESIIEQSIQYLRVKGKIKHNVKTIDNQVVTGEIIKMDTLSYFLNSRRKTTQIPFDDVISKQKIYNVIFPYSVGIATYNNPFAVPILLDMEANLWRNQAFAFGLSGRGYSFGAVALGIYGGLNITPNTMLKIESSFFLNPYPVLINELNLRQNIGLKRRFYCEVGVSFLYGYIPTFINLGTGHRF